LFDWFGRWRAKIGLNMKLRHIGYSDLPDLDVMLSNFNLRESFTTTGYLPHDQSLMEIRRHHMNVLMLSDQMDLSYVIPSKLFELLRAEPPMIAILPRGNAARELLEHLGLPQVFIVDTYDDFCQAADACMEMKRERSRTVPDAVSQFEWEKQIVVLEEEIAKL
jgi:hypothetical protein